MAVKSYKSRYNTQLFASKKNNSFFFGCCNEYKNNADTQLHAKQTAGKVCRKMPLGNAFFD